MESIKLITKISIYKIDEYDNVLKKLIEKAQEATKSAYAPYSNYQVGAALLLDNEEIITGNNQENIAYPSGLCAERTAAFYANAKYPNNKITAIAIAAYHQGKFTETVCTPCGSCRQALLELESKNNHPIQFIMTSANKAYVADSIKSLLPLSFDNDSF